MISFLFLKWGNKESAAERNDSFINSPPVKAFFLLLLRNGTFTDAIIADIELYIT